MLDEKLWAENQSQKVEDLTTRDGQKSRQLIDGLVTEYREKVDAGVKILLEEAKHAIQEDPRYFVLLTGESKGFYPDSVYQITHILEKAGYIVEKKRRRLPDGRYETAELHVKHPSKSKKEKSLDAQYIEPIKRKEPACCLIL